MNIEHIIKILEVIIRILEVVIWPGSTLIILFLFRNPIRKFITESQIKSIKGMGFDLEFKIREMGKTLDKVNIQIEKVESMAREARDDTKNTQKLIYEATGELKQARDSVWQYVAEILASEKVSPNTAYEMRRELNIYHLSNLKEKEPYIDEISTKQILNKIGLYTPTDIEKKTGFNEEITPEFIDAVYKFQKKVGMKWSDGIVGPNTRDQLLERRDSVRSPN